jgi:hypothetical protein
VRDWALAALCVFMGVEALSRAAVTRWLWRELLRLFVLADLAAVRLVQKIVPPRYELRGACDQRGVCCTQIVGNPPRFVKRGRLIHLFAWYHQIMHNFHVVARGTDDELIFRCGHLQTDGRCGIYRHRPRLCRNYPVLPWFGPPRLLPGCGFQVVPRGLKAHPRLPILNATVAVHHPTPPRRPGGTGELPEDYHWVEVPD